MAGKQPQGGWFGEQRRHSEAAKKGQREVHQPAPQAHYRARPTEIAGISSPVAIPMDAEYITTVPTQKELIEDANKLPPSVEKMATYHPGEGYTLWAREKK